MLGMKSIKFSIELARTSKRKWGEVICTGRGWGVQMRKGSVICGYETDSWNRI